jgi:hypothetical protein
MTAEFAQPASPIIAVSKAFMFGNPFAVSLPPIPFAVDPRVTASVD